MMMQDRAAPMMRLAAYEGPLDLLLDLARAQRVDLALVSIVALADQFVDAVESAGKGAALAQRGDWLVMAAWLVLLKSRLLLPVETEAGQAAQREADQLRDRLALRQRLDEAVAWLAARPRLGQDVFGRAAAGSAGGGPRGGDVVALLEACLVALRIGEREAARSEASHVAPLWRVTDALARIRDLLGVLPDGSPLMDFLPPSEARESGQGQRALRRRATLASTLIAGLEMTREGSLTLRQESLFGEISVHAMPSSDRSAA